MKSKKLVLVCLSLIFVLALASCEQIFSCNFSEEWKFDETNHWHECACGLKDAEGEHTFGEWNATENGEKLRECSVCGYTETEKVEEPVHEHNYSDKWSKDADYHWHACSGCNVTSDKAEHSWDEGVVTTTATEEADGVKTFTCGVCGATKEEAIPKLEHYHSFADTWSYDESYHWYASTCGHESEIKDKAEHSYDNVCDADCNVCGATRTPADHTYDSCTDIDCNECGATRDEGEHIYDDCTDATCNSCGDERTAPGHFYNSVVTSPTCENDGYTTNICTECGDTNISGETPSLGHDIVADAAVAPTCDTTGLEAGEHCSRCDYKVEQAVISAKGHNYVAVYVWGENNAICTASMVCENDASHISETETATVSTVTLNVTASKVTYTYNALFTSESFSAQSKAEDGEISITENIATVNAPAIENRVASHDYVKFDLQNLAESQEFTIYYSELDVWDGVTVSESLSGSGTAEDPYLIESGADLAYIDANMTATENFKGVYFKMTKSIDLGGRSVKLGLYPGWGGRIIFSGIFDGNNCSVRNLNMTESGMGAGLFSVVSGTVKNLSVYGSVKGDGAMTGGIAGWLYNGTLENCTNYVNVTSTATAETGAIVGTCQKGTMTNCVNYGSVTGIDSVGGFAGKASGTLTGCINYGAVNGCSDIGGIYGSVHSSGTPTVENCTDLGTVKAHDLTHYDAKSNSCEEDGNLEYWACSVCKKNYDADGKAITSVVISATGHDWDDGVVSEDIIIFTCGNCGNTKQESAVYSVTVNHLFLDGTIAADAEVFEYGYNDTYTVNAKAIEGYAASHDYVKGTVIANTTVTIYYSEVDIWDGVAVSTSLSGSGTEADPYLIQSAADLAYFAKVINEHNVEGTFTKDHTSREVYTVFAGKYFKLTKSIDLNGHLLKIGYSLAWNKYSRFGGIFDGNNCSVRGINITSDDANRNDALFGMVYGGTIKNLSTYGSVYGGGVLNGGVVGYLVSGTVENCSSYVNIEGNNETGGIVGNLDKGTVINCNNYGAVTCTGASAGVIVGKNASGTITNCVSFTELNAE